MSEEQLKLESQQVLDELWLERLIPFKLIACRVETDLGSYYTVTFHDSRLHSVTVRFNPDVRFGTLVRLEVLREIAVLRSSGENWLGLGLANHD